MYKTNKAFTMIELVFVIVIIGILSAVAIPKFAATRGDAVILKAKNTVSSVRSALSTERQKRILRGTFTPIASLSTTTGVGALVFDGFDGNVSNPVLEYPIRACSASTDQECWYMPDATTYRFNLPGSGNVDFDITNNRFDCKVQNSNCNLLTR